MGLAFSSLLLACIASISSTLAAEIGSLIQSPVVLLVSAVIVALIVAIVLTLIIRRSARKQTNQNSQKRVSTGKRNTQQTPISAKQLERIPAWNWQNAPTVLVDAGEQEALDVPRRPAKAQAQQRISSSGRLIPGVELQKRYRIERAVASGGMGAVYRAYDLNLQHACAVKEMLERFQTDEERQQGLSWFQREARMLLNLHHPAIPRIFDAFADHERHYLVMDFIEGRTLAEALAREGQPRGLPEARVRHWALQLCQVLAYLHRQQPPVIFRDLKPANIMVTSRDEIKLIDFGIARIFQEGTGTVVMTPGYAPLEQMGGNPEPRSDLYALGATLYQLLTLKNPRDNKPTIFDFVPLRQLRPEISPGFAAVISRAVQRDLADRWSSAAEMEQALHGLAHN